MRGRPTLEQVNSIDRSIVDAARAMFLADGFDAVGMKQVAERARVSKGTLYARYASKEALFTAVIERSIEDWSDEYAQRDSLLSSDIEQRLRHHAGTIANSLVRADVLAVQRLVLSLEDRFPALAEVVRGKGYDYIVGLLVRDLKDAAARDGTPLRDPLAVARLLVAGITGAQMQEGPRIEEKALHDYAQRVVDLIMSGRDAW
jgi:AcrR family transcriptional regulator